MLHLTELTDSRTKPFVGAERLESTCAAFATHFGDVVAPPVKVGFGVLQAEEDDDA